MRIFENTQDAYDEILKDLMKFGRFVNPKTQQNKFVGDTDKWNTKELQAYCFSVINDSDKLETCKDPEWVINEFHERMNPTEPWINPGEAWKLRANYWKDYMPGDKLHYSYNERLGPHIHSLINTLKNDPSTRQGMLVLWHQDIDENATRGRGRVPCSISYQLMVREDKLDIIYYMRSCDYYEHFRNDFTLASLFKESIASKLGIEPGSTIMFIASLHAYKKDLPSLFELY